MALMACADAPGEVRISVREFRLVFTNQPNHRRIDWNACGVQIKGTKGECIYTESAQVLQAKRETRMNVVDGSYSHETPEAP